MEGKKFLANKKMIHKCIAGNESYEKGNNISKKGLEGRTSDEYSLWMLILSIPCPP